MAEKIHKYGPYKEFHTPLFSDHQWWGLAWARAFVATNDKSYLNRSVQVFDYIALHGWDEKVCGGGVTWCPVPTNPYKNAITVELFVSLAMALHPFASISEKGATYYSDWARKGWEWIRSSGLINSQWLLNDGLNGATCKNNGQTTWTYNQGVLLSGLYRLTRATGDPAPLQAALQIANATMYFLVVDGILTEPCPGGVCGSDGQIFKGMFVKHLGYMLEEDAENPLLPSWFVQQAIGFLARNARSMLTADACTDGGFGFRWDGSDCDVETTATDSAALDLFTATAVSGAAVSPTFTWEVSGLGNCQDSSGKSMSNCFSADIEFFACRDAAFANPGAQAFDFHLECLAGGKGFCRVRTLSGAQSCGGGFQYEQGAATNVSEGDGSALTLCYLRAGP